MSRYIDKKSFIVVCILLSIFTLEIQAQSPRFSFSSDTITLDTSTIQKREAFKIYKGQFTSLHQITDKKSILGSYSHKETKSHFIPILPLQKNTDYTVVYENELFPFTITLDVTYKHMEIENIYPNTTTLPSNFLKWYIRFSKPVNPSKIYEHISLINNRDSTKVTRALLPLETPLLSDDGTLLTIWIEPGRQKRDLGPNKRLGEVLTPDSSYTLIIDKSIKDTQGIPMQMDFKHSFIVSTSDRKQPSITTWEFHIPEANTKTPLYIDIKEFLDYGSLQNALHIVDNSGIMLEGTFSINTNFKYIEFTPSNTWKKGNYTIICKSKIEDLSGNNLERLFDQDITIKKKSPVLQHSFTIK